MKMKAVICTKYGPPEVLQIREIARPIPKNTEVLIKIHATTVHIGDTKIRRLEPGLGRVKDVFYKPIMRLVLGFKGPRKKILGMELAGEIVDIGNDVNLFQKGDKVFGSTEVRFGTYAEYCCLPEKSILTKMSNNMSFEQAAPISNGGLTALLNLRKAKIKRGHKILIYGASGSVGTYAVQLAKYFGASVTAVCSTPNFELVNSLGADYLLDYKLEDFTLKEEKYDIILDAVGKIPFSKRRKSLSSSGIYINILDLSNQHKLKVKDLNLLKELFEKGELKSVIDKNYPIDKIVEAHRYVDKGHKKGNVIITVT